MPPTDPALLQLAEADRDRDRATEEFQRAVLRAVEQGHSQIEVADALGVTQPAVSQMLRTARARSRLSRGPVGRRLMEHRRDVRDIARATGATHLRVFRSVALGEDHEGSDIDLLVRMPSAGLFEITGLGLEISDLLGLPVDVIPDPLWRKIKGTRNRIAHEYGFVDRDVLRTILERDVATFAAQVAQLRITVEGPGV